MKNLPEDDLAEAPYEAENLQQEPWIDHSSGRGRGARGRGRGRTRTGRSQRRAVSSRSEASQRSTATNSERFGQLLGWKGRSRGRGGRKRGRRTARSRQKPVKRVVEIGSERERDQRKEMLFENTVRSSDLQWNREETMGIEMGAAENSSSSSERSDYDDYNGQAMGDEYDDLIVDAYSGAFNGRPERLRGAVDYNIDGEEDDDDRAEELEDDDGDDADDSEEDGQGDTDVERYINGDSDDDEGNRDGEQISNRGEEGTASSSSDYSD